MYSEGEHPVACLLIDIVSFVYVLCNCLIFSASTASFESTFDRLPEIGCLLFM